MGLFLTVFFLNSSSYLMPNYSSENEVLWKMKRYNPDTQFADGLKLNDTSRIYRSSLGIPGKYL